MIRLVFNVIAYWNNSFVDVYVNAFRLLGHNHICARVCNIHRYFSNEIQPELYQLGRSPKEVALCLLLTLVTIL